MWHCFVSNTLLVGHNIYNVCYLFKWLICASLHAKISHTHIYNQCKCPERRRVQILWMIFKFY